MTTVVNLRKDEYDIYIGRGSPFGNPFKIGKDGTRKQVIDKFQRYISGLCPTLIDYLSSVQVDYLYLTMGVVSMMMV